MLKNVGEFLKKLLDYLLPKRSDFEIVSKLTEHEVNELPRSEKVPVYDWINPLFKYKDKKVKAIVWELKYKNNTLPLDYLGKIFFDEIFALISDISTFDTEAQFILIPIPITNSRRSERGYNQSEYICRAIVQNDMEHILLYAPQWLWKTKDTPSQSHSESKEERMKNLLGSFEANSQVENKYIVLIDDVVTTGTTLSEARKTLLSSGARDVFAFTIAH